MVAQLFIPWFRAKPWVLDVPFRDRDLVLQPFAVSVIAALVVGYAVALFFARRQDRPLDLTMSLALYLVLFSFPISYVLNGLLYQPGKFFEVLLRPSEIADAELGWSMYGGIIGTIAGAWVWKWRHKASILEVGDAFAFAGPFGWSIARVGCFVTHDHPGRVSDFWLAVADYQVGSPPYEARHDLGLYDVLILVAIAVTFVALSRRPRKPGFYVGLLPVLYAPCRFLLDFLRAPLSEGGDIRYVGLTPAQYGSVLLLVAGVVVLRHVAKTDAAPS
ncbi:MAG: prolipoprotein diacylglyceryl transferase [Myxococcales bacterium]|nr:prolipoprotein diacylglyceryl transferase [Myxococcales bacterium]